MFELSVKQLCTFEVYIITCFVKQKAAKIIITKKAN